MEIPKTCVFYSQHVCVLTSPLGVVLYMCPCCSPLHDRAGTDCSIWWWCIHLPVLFSINQLIVMSIKCEKIKKNGHQSFQEAKIMSWNVLFSLTHSLKPKDVEFTIKSCESFHLRSWKEMFLCIYVWKVTQTMNQLSEALLLNFLISQLISQSLQLYFTIYVSLCICSSLCVCAHVT